MSASSTPTARRWFRSPPPSLEPLLGTGPQAAPGRVLLDVRVNAPNAPTIDEWADIILGADNAERLRERYIEAVDAELFVGVDVAAGGGWTNVTIRPSERWDTKTPAAILDELARTVEKITGLPAARALFPLPDFKYEPAMDAPNRVAPWMFGRVPIVHLPPPPAFTRFDDIDPPPRIPMSRCQVTPPPRPRRNPKRAAEQRWRRLDRRAMRLPVPGGRAYVKAVRVATRALARYQHTPERSR